MARSKKSNLTLTSSLSIKQLLDFSTLTAEPYMTYRRKMSIYHGKRILGPRTEDYEAAGASMLRRFHGITVSENAFLN